MFFLKKFIILKCFLLSYSPEKQCNFLRKFSISILIVLRKVELEDIPSGEEPTISQQEIYFPLSDLITSFKRQNHSLVTGLSAHLVLQQGKKIGSDFFCFVGRRKSIDKTKIARVEWILEDSPELNHIGIKIWKGKRREKIKGLSDVETKIISTPTI